MSSFLSGSDIEPEWADARLRLESYLRALQIASQEQIENIVQAVIQKAKAEHKLNPAGKPTVLVMNEIRELSERWFENVLESHERTAVTGYVSLFALDASKKWPHVFLSEEVPSDFKDSVRNCAVRAAPDLKFSSMVPQPFDNALHDVMNLPSPLAELAKGRVSLVAKLFAVVLSWLSFWSGNRLR